MDTRSVKDFTGNDELHAGVTHGVPFYHPEFEASTALLEYEYHFYSNCDTTMKLIQFAGLSFENAESKMTGSGPVNPKRTEILSKPQIDEDERAEYKWISHREMFDKIFENLETHGRVTIPQEIKKSGKSIRIDDVNVGDVIVIDYTPYSQKYLTDDFRDSRGKVFFIDKENEDILMHYDEPRDGKIVRIIMSLTRPYGGYYGGRDYTYSIHKILEDVRHKRKCTYKH